MNGENQTARELGVPSRLARNSKTVSEITQLACKLEDRLMCISQSLPPATDGLKAETPRPSPSHVHDHLDEQNGRLQQIAKRLESILGRLEV